MDRVIRRPNDGCEEIEDFSSGERLILEQSNRHVPLPDREKWMEGIFDIYRRMRRKPHPYEIKLRHLDLTVLPDVYAPDFFSDSFWFADRIPEIVGKKSILEIGTGTGIIALSCALTAARVVATDINPAAVQNARINVRRNRRNVSVREGDLFSPVAANEKFDVIFWSHPFNNWDSPVSDMLLRSGLDYHYGSLEKYFCEAATHLSPDGKLLLGTGDSADLRSIAEFARKNSLSTHLLAQTELPLEIRGKAQIKLLIYEFVPTRAGKTSVG